MPQRWKLNRAGIVNVYQYGDETLHFGGGRLLLRGVNGSGKSTAMNMLLPFLLEADTRRIDAAGEQAGVLRAWMLSGRDEQQPVGYLWIELRRNGRDGPEHLTCGCGIRANRSTDRVTTWWFVTPRRPGIDLALVESRTPLSIDALRAELGHDAVFAHDQRNGYRAEIRNRLYGGADLDQHLRLLHVVRNPRVGDRIDLDLPNYLEDALPQLSETALDDAAQPLEDLEEHRRNVEDLTRTAAALDALEDIYRDYVRSDLHGRVDAALSIVDDHRAATRQLVAIRREVEDARAERDEARRTIETLDADERRLRQEIESLTSRDAYQAGAELTDLRDHVDSLTRQVTAAAAEFERRSARRDAARGALDAARRDALDDRDALGVVLSDLAQLVGAAGVTTRTPDAPAITFVPARGHDVELPTNAVDPEAMRKQLGDVRAGARARGGDIREVRRALDGVDAALRRVDDAERAVHGAEAQVSAAEQVFTDARRARDDAVERWRAALQTWTDQVDEHVHTHGAPVLERPTILALQLAEQRSDIAQTLVVWVQQTVDHHQRTVAALEARRSDAAATVAEIEARLAELRSRVLPDPPAAPWQRGDRGACLAELIDFAAHVDPSARAGLEAAMEAAGLLGAEVMQQGLLLADGQLLARGAKPAERALSELLDVTVPDELGEIVTTSTVADLLDSISTNADDMESPDGQTVVTIDGRFRLGALRGRHAKTAAEHIGVTARRATLQRQRQAAADELAVAREALASTDVLLTQASQAALEAVALRDALPSHQPLSEAILHADHSARELERARDTLAERNTSLQLAEEAHREAADASARTAANHGLPHDRPGLDDVDVLLLEVAGGCDRAESATAALARSVSQWIVRGDEWLQAIDDANAGENLLTEARHQRDRVAAKLATLEDSFGLEYDEIVAAIDTSQGDLRRTTDAVGAARQRELEAHGRCERLSAAATSAMEQRDRINAAAVAALGTLRAALAVPGLLPTAMNAASLSTHDDAPDAASSAFPAVPEDTDGLRQLAEAIRERIPKADRDETNAESVRQSLRRRRDTLGAGWDAEDRQPEMTLPLHVEVTGPLGRMPLHEAAVRVHTQHRHMASLLSAKQDQALRNLLQGLIAREVAEKLHRARELVGLMNDRLDTVSTSHGIGVSLRWQRRDDLDDTLARTITLLAKPPDLRTADEDHELAVALSDRIGTARAEDPDAPYRQLVAQVLDYRTWHRMSLVLRRPGRDPERLTRRTALSEGEKKMVSYLPLFAAVAASCDALAERAPDAPRFVLLDDAFAKVSEDNHPKLFGLLVELDLDFIATSERLWGTHATVPELAITEVLRDADLGVIVLEHSHWDGRIRSER